MYFWLIQGLAGGSPSVPVFCMSCLKFCMSVGRTFFNPLRAATSKSQLVNLAVGALIDITTLFLGLMFASRRKMLVCMIVWSLLLYYMLATSQRFQDTITESHGEFASGFLITAVCFLFKKGGAVMPLQVWKRCNDDVPPLVLSTAVAVLVVAEETLKFAGILAASHRNSFGDAFKQVMMTVPTGVLFDVVSRTHLKRRYKTLSARKKGTVPVLKTTCSYGLVLALAMCHIGLAFGR